MTVEGVDYSSANPGGAALAKAGKVFAMRYVGVSAVDPRALTTTEIDDLHAHGLAVGFIWESTAGRAKQGLSAGIADGKTALSRMTTLGIPVDKPIYFAVDFNAATTDYPAIDAYLKGAAQSMTLARTGVYGHDRLIDHCFIARTVSYGFQTYAWSNGVVSSFANVLQYLNGQDINGAVDLDRALKADYGQWEPVGSGPNVPGDAPMEWSNHTPVLIDIPTGTQLTDENDAPLWKTTVGQVGVPSPFQLEINPTRHVQAIFVTGAKGNVVAFVHDYANLRPVPVPPPDCTTEVAAAVAPLNARIAAAKTALG